MQINYELFEGRLNEVFNVSLGDTSVDMILTEARRGPVRPPMDDIRTDPFSLYFKCTGQIFPAQGTYNFGNPTIGNLEIFVVPIRKEKDGIIYEAIFN